MEPRQIAYKITLKDLEKGRFEQAQGASPNGIRIGSTLISRVQIIAVVTAHSDAGFVIDDGTSSMSVRVFEERTPPPIGSVISLVGRPREFQTQRYIIPEGYVQVDSAWLKVRQKELERITYSETHSEFDQEGTPEESKIPVQETAEKSLEEENVEDVEEIVDEPAQNPLEALLTAMKALDDGSGITYEDLTTVCDDAMIQKLLEAGEIFEIRPGMYKVLE
jgi:hypothetical protein